MEEPELTFIEAKNKYAAIKTRAFKSYLDLFLICSYITDKNLSHSAILETFKTFDYNDKRIPKANTAYQIPKGEDKFEGEPIDKLDEAIENWHAANDTSPYKDFFMANRIISWEDFKDFYGSDNPYANEKIRFCHYCHLDESHLEYLINNGKLYTKRLSTRGRTFEIDRKDPTKGYTKDNMVLSCYWCNNAKTDEFTYEEFLPIGEQFKHLWVKRIFDK